jgi:transcriptional regulator GlxA family with amidase domain
MRFAILVYDGVEPIDIGATFGVLSMARRVAPQIGMFAVAARQGEVTLANGLRMIADSGYDDRPDAGILVVTGGPGWQDAARHEPTLAFIRDCAKRMQVAALCTGAMILGAAGVLAGHAATTKQEVTGSERPPIDLLKGYPGVVPVRDATLVDDGVVTSGGVSLGIDGMLYLLRRHLGAEIADETARILEYSRALEANRAALPWVTGQRR